VSEYTKVNLVRDVEDTQEGVPPGEWRGMEA
jgi:hypothetical protein